MLEVIRLIEGVGVGSPPSEEQAEAYGLEDTGKGTNGDGVHWTFLGENLRDELEYNKHQWKRLSVVSFWSGAKFTLGAELAMKIKDPR